MRLETLCHLSGLETPADLEHGTVEISAVATHSRACVPGCIYVCIPGMRADGHAFIEEALAKGAAAVVTERHHPCMDGFVTKHSSAIFLPCDDTRRACAALYRAWYGNPDEQLSLIGVTGTNGKTTTASLICVILERAGIETGLIGTLGCRCRGRELIIRAADECANMTTPDPEQLFHMLAVMVEEGVRTVVMEVSSHALALQKVWPLHFDVALFTNFTQDHLDFHGSMQAYFEAKASLLKQCSTALINVDDPAFCALQSRTKAARTVSCIREDTDYYAKDAVSLGADGVEYIFCEKSGGSRLLRCTTPGSFTVKNTLLAAACARHMGVSTATIHAALDEFCGVRGRMERVSLPDGVPCSVFIDYAHTPDAMEKLLCSARDFRGVGQRIVLLFGCGGDRDQTKRPRMAAVAAKYADVIYLTSDNSRSEDPESILDQIAAGLPPHTPYTRITRREDAIRHAIIHAHKDDIILLAGKGHETYEIDRTGRHPFDEREIAHAAALVRLSRSGQIEDDR